MSKLFAVVTHNIMTGIGVVAGLITVATGTGLSFVTQVQLYFSKAQKIRDGILDAHTIMPDTVLDMFEARFTNFSSERAHAVWRSERSVGSRRSIVAEYRKFASGLHQKVSVLQKHRSQIDEFAG